MPVSIIIPAFNEEKYIEETLKALPSGHEVIVVCNGCTDKTALIARKYTDKVIITDDKGVSKAKNLGASKATHEKLIFLDADIVIKEDVIKAIEKNKSNLGTICLKPNKTDFTSKLIIFLRNHFIALTKRGGGVIYCNINIFNKVKGFPENLSFKEDILFIKKAKKIAKYKLIKKTGIVNMRRYQKGFLKQIIIILKSWTNKKINYPSIR